MVENGKIID